MNQGILWGALLGSVFTGIFVIGSRFGLDILNLYEMIVKNQRSAFLGTLGQINVVSSFFCIFIPFWLGCYLYSRERTSKILFGIALFLVLTAGLCSNSDSIFPGIAGVYLFYLFFAFMDIESLSAYFQCGGLLFLSMSSVGFLKAETAFYSEVGYITAEAFWQCFVMAHHSYYTGCLFRCAEEGREELYISKVENYIFRNTGSSDCCRNWFCDHEQRQT